MTQDAAPRLTHQPGLDGIRGIAIALVLLSHFVPGLGGAGWIGVTVFFALSGFLITRLLLAEIGQSGKVDLPAFYVRRAGRLVPELVAVVLVVTVVAAWTGEQRAPANAFGALTYTADFIVASGGLLGPLSHTWSLAVEEQFYLLWPLAIMLLMTRLSRPLLLVIALAVAALVWRDVMVLGGVDVGRYFGPDGQLDALMAGCALALVTSSGRLPSPSRALILVAVFIIGAAAFAQQVGGIPLQAAAGIPLTVAGTLILISAVGSGRASWLSFAPVAWLGVISYSLYLWHVPILLATWAVFGQQPIPTIAALVVAFAVAAVSYRLARPIRLWARDAVARRRWSGDAYPIRPTAIEPCTPTSGVPEPSTATVTAACHEPPALVVNAPGSSDAAMLSFRHDAMPGEELRSDDVSV